MAQYNIDDLNDKRTGDELSASEFNRLVNAVIENQGSVKSVKYGGLEPVYPDDDGLVTIPLISDSWTDVFRVQRRMIRNYEEVWETLDDNGEYLYPDSDVPLRFQFKEYRQVQSEEGGTEYEASNAPLVVKILRQTATGETEVGRITGYSAQGYSSTQWYDINLRPYLSSGLNTMVFEVTGGSKGEVVRRQYYITAANLSISVNDDYRWNSRALNITTSTQISADYNVSGAVVKTLCVKFKGQTGETAVFRHQIPASSSATIASSIYTKAEDTVGFFTEGLATVTAWLESTLGDDTVTSSEVISHIICVAEGSTNNYVAIQDCITSMLNYESMTMFRYNVYSAQSPVDVTIQLASQNHQTVYLEVPLEARAVNSIYNFTSVLSIQSAETSVRVYIYAKIGGIYVNGGASLGDFLVDNSTDYGAVENADFYLNPMLRNNQESSPARIINAATGDVVTGTQFDKVSFLDGVDGWMEVSNRRVLRLLSGSTVSIPYNIYSEFTDDSLHGLTVEVDFMVRNITDETSAMLTVGNGSATNPKGIFMKSMNGAFVSASNQTWESVDVSWQESVRTHIVFNYQHNYTLNNPEQSRGHSNTVTFALQRTYINGVIEKEYRIANTASASEINAGGNIVLCPTGCDLDIYGIRVYKRNLTPEQVKKNHRSTLNTTTEKKADYDANDILSNGLISLERALAAGYDCIVWHGTHISRRYKDNPKRIGYYQIWRHNADGSLDKTHSGTQYGVEASGQGTTAMTYADWNVSFKEDKSTGEGHDEYKYDDPLTGGKKNLFVDMNGVVAWGAQYTAEKDKRKFGYQMEDGDPVAKKLVGKINYASSMQSHKLGACNLYNDLYKICVATEGSSYSYDRAKCITNFSKNQRVTVKERPFLYFVQEQEGADDALKVFKGLMTFGPGKADKPTWGVDDDTLTDGDSLIEGALNNNPLTDMRVPFVDTIDQTTGRYVNEYQIKDDQNNKVEAFVYAGQKNLNWGFGDTLELHATGDVVWAGVRDGDKTNADAPTTKQVKMWQPIWNFLYLMNTRIQPWSGTLRELNIQVQQASFDSSVAYWMTRSGDGYSQLDLYRCHYKSDGTRLYVPAGIMLRRSGTVHTNFDTLYDLRTNPTGVAAYTDTDMWYDVTDPATDTRDITLNLRTELNSMISRYSLGVAINYSDDPSLVNTAMRRLLCTLFRLYVDNNVYLHKKSMLFHHEMMVLWAGTDNRSKNTYYRLNPYAEQTIGGVARQWPNMEMNDDDLDTILKTNNVGIQSKPYYALEDDTDPNLGTKYWQGQDNVLNNALQDAYGYGYLETAETNLSLSNMMGQIFAGMASLANGKTMPDGTAVSPDPIGCFDYYFFYVQKYFPAVAYNETARLRYEVPSRLWWNQSSSSGEDGEDYPEDPMNQSVGDQYDSEKDYVRRRITMLAGYAGYRMNQFGFRGYAGVFSSDIIPHQYIYPMYEVGDQQSSRPTRTMQRVAPGETFTLTFSNSSQTSGVYIFFIGALRELGNIASWSDGTYNDEASTTALAPSGTRLTKFEMWSVQAEGVVFNPRSGKFDLSACRNIETIDVHNAYRLLGIDGTRELVRLTSLDARGTAFTGFTLPETPALVSLQFPSTMETLAVIRNPNLATLTLQGYASLAFVEIHHPVQFDSMALMQAVANTNRASETGNILSSLTLTGINWSNCPITLLDWMLTVENVTLTGRIHMSRQNGQVPFATKKRLIDLFGDVDSEDNALYLDYEPYSLTSIAVSGDGYFDEVNEEKYYDLIPNISAGNTIRSYEWTLIGSSYGETDDYIEISDPRGVFRCKQMGTEAQSPTITVRCTVVLTTGATLTADATIRCYKRNAHIGDYVYSDGSWDDRLNVSKTVIGICFYCKQIYENGQPTGRYDRRMVALANTSSRQWGLYDHQNNQSYIDVGFPSDLTFDDNGTPTSPFDIPSSLMPNFTGTANATYANMIDDQNPSEEYPDDDPQRWFKTVGATECLVHHALVPLGTTLKKVFFAQDDSVSADTMVPQGYHDTLAVIYWRNKVLTGTTFEYEEDGETVIKSAADFVPNDIYPSNLGDKILEIRDFALNELGDTNNEKYSQYLYPAASQCYAYQPTVPQGRTLDERFKSHHWYLPSIGEEARLVFLDMVCNSGSTLYNANAYAKFGDIFAKAVAANIYTRHTAAYYWSSSESSRAGAWVAYFSTGNIGSYGKYGSYSVRPCAAF